MADEISTSDCTVSHISQWLCSTSARNITKTISFTIFAYYSLGVSQPVCSAHFRLLCAVGHATTFAVNAALVANQ